MLPPTCASTEYVGLITSLLLNRLNFSRLLQVRFLRESITWYCWSVIFYRTDAIADAQITVTTSKLSNYHMCNVYHLINNIETV